MRPVHRLLALSLLLASPTAPAIPPMVFVSPKSIVQVICFAPNEVSAGTAFRIGNGLFLSVNHVTSAGVCYMAGKPVVVDYKSPTADFSMLAGDAGPSLPIGCGGFVKDHRYIAIGFARGLSQETTVELTATGQFDHGEALLYGMFTVIPGQSGGPILDEDTGQVVGTINAYDYEDGLSWSVPLSATPVCGAKA
jgi:hypothetical protein